MNAPSADRSAIAKQAARLVYSIVSAACQNKMNRLDHADLAEILGRNPDVRISRENRLETLASPGKRIPCLEPSDQPEAAKWVKSAPHSPKADYKAELVQQCALLDLKLEPEFRFHPERKFRADWRVHYLLWAGNDKSTGTWIPTRVLVEYEGGLYSSGKRGHSSIAGIHRDIEKANLAQIEGYLMIRVAPSHVVSGAALKWIEQAVKYAAKLA